MALLLLWRRFGTAKYNAVEVQQVRLVHPGSLGQTLGVSRRIPAGELSVRQGRAELRLRNGHVSLMDPFMRVRVQLDGAYHPSPPLREPKAATVEAMQRMRPYAGRPVLVLSDEEEAPMVVLDSVRGVHGAPGRRRSGDGEVQDWAAALLSDAREEDVGGRVSLGRAPSWTQPQEDEPERILREREEEARGRQER
jgi:hypothetical protein